MAARTGELIDRRALERLGRNPAYQAYQILRVGFTILLVIAGVDKFFDWLVPWHDYLASVIASRLPMDSHRFLEGVGVIEILAGLIVAFAPRVGGYLVAAWLAAIIVNLLLIPGYFDVALRDLGLPLGAVALGRLSEEFAD